MVEIDDIVKYRVDMNGQKYIVFDKYRCPRKGCYAHGRHGGCATTVVNLQAISRNDIKKMRNTCTRIAQCSNIYDKIK